MHAAVDERVSQMPTSGPTSTRGPFLFVVVVAAGRRGVSAVGRRRRVAVVVVIHEYENVEIAERAQFQGGFDQYGGQRSHRHPVVRLNRATVFLVLLHLLLLANHA